jgi:hypothetical protein
MTPEEVETRDDRELDPDGESSSVRREVDECWEAFSWTGDCGPANLQFAIILKRV